MSTQQTILVTGSSRGIGKACATALGKQGAQLILLSANQTALSQTADELMAQGIKEPMLCPFDLELASADDYIALSEQLSTYTDKLDGLIHCAGRLYNLKPIEHVSIKDWHSIIQINLNARFALTQLCLPLLKQSSNAKLLFCLSQLATRPGEPFWGAYQVAEQGNKTLAEILTAELAHTPLSIHTVLCPPTDTYLRNKAYPYEDKSRCSSLAQLEEKWATLFSHDTPWPLEVAIHLANLQPSLITEPA